MQNLNDDEKIQIGRVVNMIVNGFQDKDYLILGSDVKFKDFGKSDILNAVKELNENNLASYKINLDNVKINFENKNLEEAEKNEFMDKDLEKYTCMTETQRKINKLKWLLFCHLEADKQSFQDLYASMLVNENVLGKNQFEILSLFPYLRLYWDLSENERKLFSNSCLPKVFFEQDFLKDMMQWHYIDDSTLIPKTKDCRQGFREMFINICQSRLDKMQKSGVSKKLDFLCESALSIYYSGNSLFHCLTKNDHGFTTIKSFCDKNSDENTFDAIKLADEFINLKKSNSPHINISGEKQKFLAFMYCFFCIDIFSQGKGTKQKFFKLPRFELCFRSLRCTFLFFFLICLIFTICEFSVFYAIMTTIVFCGNLVVSMIAKWGDVQKNRSRCYCLPAV